jgi:lipopolysaccharide/colanic/teichoic acid biosynthesis glycosyltransferase
MSMFRSIRWLQTVCRTVVERLLAAVGLALASPLLIFAGAAIVFEDGFPVLFRQTRVGMGGRTFDLWKLRSMRSSPEAALITAANDTRVTKVGRMLRRYKLDELPQLWNIVRGEMSLIGPRPEVPRFVDFHDPQWQRILSVRPGITDVVTLLYRDEEHLLSAASNPEVYYRTVVLPEKMHLNIQYLKHRSLVRDAKLLVLTARYSFIPAGFSSETIRRSLT